MEREGRCLCQGMLWAALAVWGWHEWVPWLHFPAHSGMWAACGGIISRALGWAEGWQGEMELSSFWGGHSLVAQVPQRTGTPLRECLSAEFSQGLVLGEVGRPQMGADSWQTLPRAGSGSGRVPSWGGSRAADRGQAPRL